MTAVNTTLYGKQGETKFQIYPKTSAEQVDIPAIDGSASTVADEIVTIRQLLNEVINAGVRFQSEVTSENPLPSVSYKKGWVYIVKEKGVYAGDACEVGDMILCVRDYASGSASDNDWTVLQANLTGAVTGPSSSVAAHVAIFSGTSGTVLADSGYTIAKSVPADAQFTDTTYLAATTTSDGLMTAGNFVKLQGIEEGADKTTATNVKAAGAFMISQNTADNISDGTTKKLMTATERQKLEGIDQGAQANQNAVSSIKVGTATINAESTTDQVEIEAGQGITITADTSTKKITVGETYIDSCVVEDLDSVPSNLREGGLIILKS